jgi:hypothetical protein
MVKSDLDQMIRLCIGISHLSAGWQCIADQLGVNIEEIDFEDFSASKFSSLIINSSLDHEAAGLVYRFINDDNGGIILTDQFSSYFSNERSLTQRQLNIPQEYNRSITQYNLGAGVITTLSFEPDYEYARIDYQRKRFSFKTNKHPDELVSSVDRESIRQTLLTLLKDHHFHRDLPFVSKWDSPTKTPFFAFRVDTDFGDKDSIKKLYALAEEHQIPMTWFLHVQAHEEWLNYFHSLENQEIALHGYEHGTSTSFEHIINNIERGKQLMLDNGLNPMGYCVPYSIWNETFGEVLDKFEFKYSSEFTLGYDTTPFYPIHRRMPHSTLQIPIHPICTGSLNRKKASLNEMTEYFDLVLAQKVELNQNVIFYHHPLQPGLELWKSIFNQVNELGLSKLTFTQIADFWNTRLESVIELNYDLDSKTLTCNSSNPDLYLNFSVNFDEYYLIKTSKVNEPLNHFEPLPTTRQLELSQTTINELEGNRLQLLKTSILDWKNRKKL